jgi:hypothetical protein
MYINLYLTESQALSLTWFAIQRPETSSICMHLKVFSLKHWDPICLCTQLSISHPHALLATSTFYASRVLKAIGP